MSAAGVFPAVPGVDLAEDQKTEIWTICLTLSILGVLFVGVRGISRWTQSKRVPLALDDYLILPALVKMHSYRKMMFQEANSITGVFLGDRRLCSGRYVFSLFLTLEISNDY